MRELGIEDKISRELDEREHEPLLIFGFDNLRYLTGSALPFVNDLDPEYIEYYQKKLYRDYYLNLSYILNQLKNIRGFFDIGRLLKSAINVLDFAGF